MVITKSLLKFGLLLIIFHENCAGNRYNISYAVLGKCKEYSAMVGYNYKTFFRIDELNNYKEPDHLLGEDLLRLRIIVLASKDAHLLLSQTEHPELDHAVYEIVIGAGANTFCEIRRKQKKIPLKTRAIPQVLSPIDPVPLIVRITHGGIIDVTIEGQNNSLISAYDPEPIPVKYISFSSWGSTQGKWFYDCPSAPEAHDSDENISLFTTTVEPDYNPDINDLDTFEMLESRLFDLYDYNSIPEDLYFIDIVNFELKNMRYDSKNSVLRSVIHMNFTWYDPRLVWEPEEYDNITEMREDFRSWTPSFMILNGKSDTYTSFTAWIYVTIYSDGTVIGHLTETEIETFCYLQREQSLWPDDENNCDIIIGVHGQHLQLRDSAEELKFSETGFRPEWNILRITNLTLSENLLNGGTILDEETGSIKIDVVYRIYMQRNGAFIRTISIPPLYAAMLLCLTAFWIRGHLRLTLILFSILILIGSLIMVGRYAPRNYVPPILSYYNTGLVFAILNLIAFIIDSWLQNYSSKTKPHNIILLVISNTWFRFFMILDQSETHDDYRSKSLLPWVEVSLVLNRIMFIITLSYSISVMININK